MTVLMKVTVMKKYIFLTIFCLFVTSVGWSQQIKSNVYIKQAKGSETTGYINSKNSSELSGVFSGMPASKFSYLQLLGSDASEAAQIKTTGNYNHVTIKQMGNNNAGGIFIKGDYNHAGLVQNGSSLLSIINIKGDQNTMNVNQQGQSLQNLISVEGTGIKFNVKQNASGVKLTQMGGNAIPIQVKRTGHSIPIIIKNH